MKLQFELKKLFRFNYLIAFFALIIIIVNYITYHNCNRGIYDSIYSGAAFANIIAIIVISFIIILYVLNKTGEFSAIDKKNYWYTIVNVILLLLLLITFVTSTSYAINCKKTIIKSTPSNKPENTSVEKENSNTSNRIETFNSKSNNGVLTLNIFALFNVFGLLILGFLYE